MLASASDAALKARLPVQTTGNPKGVPDAVLLLLRGNHGEVAGSFGREFGAV